MIRSCDKCKLEFLREHSDETSLFIDMELCGWYVDEVKCICASCVSSGWEPDSHRCHNCGKPVFTAWYRQRHTNFDAAPHSCGYEINYKASRPHRIAMVARTYWGLDSRDYPGRPDKVYVQHRCKKKDILKLQGQKMLGKEIFASPVNQVTYPPLAFPTNNPATTSSSSTTSTNFYTVHHTQTLGNLKSTTQSLP